MTVGVMAEAESKDLPDGITTKGVALDNAGCWPGFFGDIGRFCPYQANLS